MSEDSPQPLESPSTGPRAVGIRWVGLLLLLLAETVVLRWRFPAQTLNEVAGWWSSLLTGPSVMARVCIAFVAALLMVGGPRLKPLFRRVRDEAAAHRRWRWWLAANFLAFGGLVALATIVTVGREGTTAAPLAAQSAGTLLAATALICWIFAIAPPRALLRLVREERVAILAGVVLGVAAWAAGYVTVTGSAKLLSGWTMAIVHRVLGLIYDDVQFHPETLHVGTGRFPVEIGPLCSGLEGIGLICVFLAAFFWVFRQRLRFPQAWLLLPLGIGVMWLSNSLRITLLIMIGTHISEGVAMRGFHSQAGWIFFNIVALGLMAGALRSRFFVKDLPAPAEPEMIHGRSAAPGYVLPLLALLAASMLTSAFSDAGPDHASAEGEPEAAATTTGSLDRLYPLKVLATAAVLLAFRSTWWNAGWSWSWSAVANGAVVFALWIFTTERKPPEETAVYLGVSQLTAGWAAVWVAFRVLGSSVTVPLAEELAYRGYLWRRLKTRDFEALPYQLAPWWAAILSSVAFGLMHGRWIAGTAAGLAFAWEARRRGRIGDAILAHATANALIAADVLLNGAWWLW